jgi:hypothetical protein
MLVKWTTGSEKDVEKLKLTFQKLRFSVLHLLR